MTDPIADYLTRLRNAIKSRHRVVEVPASNIKKQITKVLFDKGYISCAYEQQIYRCLRGITLFIFVSFAQKNNFALTSKKTKYDKGLKVFCCLSFASQHLVGAAIWRLLVARSLLFSFCHPSVFGTLATRHRSKRDGLG